MINYKRYVGEHMIQFYKEATSYNSAGVSRRIDDRNQSTGEWCEAQNSDTGSDVCSACYRQTK